MELNTQGGCPDYQGKNDFLVAFRCLPCSYKVENSHKETSVYEIRRMRPDAELVEAVLGGDREAFAPLVERYERPVIAIVTRILRDRDAAQDVAQDAFVTAYVKLASLRNGAAFGRWVCQIARREALRLLRHRQEMVSLEASEETPGRSNRGAAYLDERQLRLLTAVERLPAHERQVVTLKHFDGYTVQEVAEATGRPLGTVTKQLSRAYARLRKQLKDKD